jgi:hypothetical protein
LPCNNDGDDTSCSEESNHATRSADPFCFVRYAIKRPIPVCGIPRVGGLPALFDFAQSRTIRPTPMMILGCCGHQINLVGQVVGATVWSPDANGMLKFKPRRNPRGWLVDWIGVFFLMSTRSSGGSESCRSLGPREGCHWQRFLGSCLV